MYNSYQFYLNLLLVLHLLFFFVQSMAMHADDVQFFFSTGKWLQIEATLF